MMRYLGLLLLTFFVLTGCGSEPQSRDARIYAFGTEIDISLFGVSDKEMDATVTELEKQFENVNAKWHAWQPSTLTRINEAIAEDESISVTPEVAELIEYAGELAAQSGHLFNPAAGRLFEMWGFEDDDWYESHPPPNDAEINAWLANPPTMDDINIDNGELHSTNNAARLGFGGFAKGYAVDVAIQALKKRGVENAIINIGGDLRAIGQHGERPWKIGVRHPRQDDVLAKIEVSGDESVFTSGDYERFFEYQGERYSHIIDPRTGYPAQDAQSVTVIDTDASRADAAATALFVAGDEWPAIATAMGIELIMVVRASGDIEMTAAMMDRTDLNAATEPPLIRNLPPGL